MKKVYMAALNFGQMTIACPGCQGVWQSISFLRLMVLIQEELAKGAIAMSDPKQTPSLQFLQQRREEILAVAKKHGAKNIRVFGSVARGEADEQSDIDFLVNMEMGRSLFDLGGFQYDLEQCLGMPVDVVTEKGLKARIKERVINEAVLL